jgi:outer membrane protein assembly complex protein YaeT
VLVSILLAELCPATSGSLAMGAQSDRQPYTLTIIGNHHFSEQDLLKFAAAELQKFEEKQYRKADIDDAAFQMRAAYLQAGFAFAFIDYKFEQKAKLLQVTFNVDEGPQVLINSINIVGNQHIKSEKVHDFFKAPAGSFLGRSRKMVYNESGVKDVVNRLGDYYRGEGFIDVVVQSPGLTFTADRSRVDISIEIEEGPQYFINEVALGGDLLPELSGELEKVKSEFTGKTYYLRRKLLLRTKLAEVYDHIGYAEAEFAITAVQQDKPGRMNLRAEITSGEQVRIAEIVISGNASTDESFIRDRLQFQPGDIYSKEKQRESFRNLFASGLFAKITIELAPPQADGRRNINVVVSELPTREIYVTPGWGSYEELRLGVGIYERDLFGTGRKGRIDGLVSSKGGNLTFSYQDPWLLKTDITMNIPLYYERREEPSYTSEETGMAVFFSRNLSRSFTLTTGYQYKMTQLLDLSTDTPLQDEEENYNKGSVGLQVVNDTRDDIFYPTSGSRVASGIDLALPAFGSEIEFGRITLGGRYFLALPQEYIFGLRARTGLIIPLGDQTFIPISERFFNGGDSTVRSYEHSQLGPKDDNNEPLGGLGYNVVTLELRKRLYRNFAATLYVDAGNVSPNRSLLARDSVPYTSRSELLDETLADFFSEFKFGIGLGLQYLLPVGPVRIDLAYNPDPDETWAERDWVFHFSLGMAF